MGNQLFGVAPSQIFPVEHYLTDHRDFVFDGNLGSTRFLKVARAKSPEGYVVVKVFAIHDPSLPLSTYQNRIDEIRSKLSSAVNCLPFQKAIIQDRAGFIVREYVKSSLYDRISTRPFLTSIQKKFLAFQVLYALHQCHKVGVCHGDIKLENLMVTSWNWLLLTDFASFKPVYLPEDNPADYSYFFDTSRRRTCYIAPERFVNTFSTDVSSGSTMFEQALKQGDLTPAMDIFSAGCALIEMYNEGEPPFELSQLLAYRNNDYDPQKHLDKIEDQNMRDLLAHMIQKNPALRHSAENYLDEARGKVFPEYFYSFLQSYMLIFSTPQPQLMSADEKIARLHSDIGNVVEMLCKPKTEVEEEKQDINKYESVNANAEGLVIITTLVTSCIRALHHSSSKLQSLEVLLELAKYSSAENTLDRIVPYIFHLIRDVTPAVRIRAIRTLTKVLGLVKQVPCTDANIFPEYVLPELVSLLNDKVVLVRAAFAENIADLAQIALRYIEESQDVKTVKNSETPKLSYETELLILQDMIQHIVSTLLTDSENTVKITLMEHGITRLCVFFGKHKANDVLLSHMITFLNDKEDKKLRGSFFDCLVGIVSYVGVHSSSIITPLLQQGLTDPEEFIMVKSVVAMRDLTKLDLLNKGCIYQLVEDVACFLVHPNLWLRHAIVAFIAATANKLDTVDVQCKLSTLICNYFKTPVIQLDKEYLIMNALIEPIPRVLFDAVVKCQDIDLILQTLEERKVSRNLVKAGHIPQNTPLHPAIKSLFRKLSSEGMTDQTEDQLLSMSRHLIKINRHKTNSSYISNLSETNGKIELSRCRLNITRLSAPLTVDNSKEYSDIGSRKRTDKLVRLSPESSVNVNMNSEWQHMFGTSDHHLNKMPTVISSSDLVTSPQFSLITEVDHSLPEKSYIQYRCAPCRIELRNLICRKQEKYSVTVKQREVAERVWRETPLPPPEWRLRGILAAHLHEHRGAVNKLVTIPTSGMFASCSNDGCVRLWDCNKMEGRNIANRSKCLYNRQTGALTGLTTCDSSQSLAAISVSGAVFVFKVDAASNKAVQHFRQLDIQEDGCAVDINVLDTGSQYVLVYATMYGSLVAWDLRKPGIAWKLDNDLKRGVITSFCLDSQQCWAAVATSSGYHTAWDLRFQLPIATAIHPTGARVRKVIRHPTEQSWILSSVQNSNEISMWDMETQLRQSVLWASTTPPLSTQQVNGHNINAMYAGKVDRSSFLFTGGTDMKLRFWDLDNPTESQVVVPSAMESSNSSALIYRSRLIDGMNVIHEVSPKGKTGVDETGRFDELKKGPQDELRGRGSEAPNPGHHDSITDIEMCKANQCFLATSARNGVIKVWK